STTHTITGAIVGVGATRRLSAVRWGVAGRIVWAWLLTMPAAAAPAPPLPPFRGAPPHRPRRFRRGRPPPPPQPPQHQNRRTRRAGRGHRADCTHPLGRRVPPRGGGADPDNARRRRGVGG